MDGVIARLEREREMVWWGAMLPHLKKHIPLPEFVARRVEDPHSRAERFHAAWDKIDRALERKRK